MKEIATLEDLERALESSDRAPLFLYKHSTACPVSFGALGRIEDLLGNSLPDEFPEIVMIKVIESRSVSLAIAKRLGVKHQSPQLILVRGGEAIWDASHFGITADAITGAVREHLG